MLNQTDDVIRIVGGGVAGLATGLFLREKGYHTFLYEEHSQIGLPESCSGLISTEAYNSLRRHVELDYQNKIVNAHFFFEGTDDEIVVGSPNTRAYVVDRSVLDSKLFEAYVSLGGNYSLGRRIEENELASFSTIVGCDGANSLVARFFNFPEIRDYVKTYQCIAEVSCNDIESVYVFFSRELFPGFFGWIIPIDEKFAKVGCGTALFSKVNLKLSLGEMIKWADTKNICEIKKFLPLELSGGVIPLQVRCKTAKEEKGKKIFLVGDSAGQVKSFSGGGIYFAYGCAKHCAAHIDEPLVYETSWRKDYYSDLLCYYLARKLIEHMPYDWIAKMVKLLKLEDYLYKRGEMDRLSKCLKGEYVVQHVRESFANTFHRAH